MGRFILRICPPLLLQLISPTMYCTTESIKQLFFLLFEGERSPEFPFGKTSENDCENPRRSRAQIQETRAEVVKQRNN